MMQSRLPFSPGLAWSAGVAVAVLILVPGLLGPAWGAWPAALGKPEPAPEAEPLVNNSFYETDLRQALSDLAIETGVPIVCAPEVRGFVTLDLVDVPLPRALDMMLSGTGFLPVRQGGYYFVCPSDPKSPAFRDISSSRMVKLNFAEAETAHKALSESVAAYCRPDKALNAIFVSAPQPMLERIEREIRVVDVAPGHVLLDAVIVVMEKQDLLNLGIQWGFPTAQAGLFTNNEFATDDSSGLLDALGLSWPWGVQVGYTADSEFTNALQLKLNLLSQNGEASIVASPQVMAQDGREAKIEVVTEEYFQVYSDGYYASADLDTVEAGTLLTILPRVGENGEITLSLAAEVSDVVARFESGLPVVTRRKAASTVRVKDGGTAAVAGLIDSRIFLSNERVPFISRLPLVGRLFSNDYNREENRQVAVFVTARLVPERGEASRTLRPTYEPVSGWDFKPQLERALDEILRGRKEGAA